MNDDKLYNKPCKDVSDTCSTSQTLKVFYIGSDSEFCSVISLDHLHFYIASPSEDLRDTYQGAGKRPRQCCHPKGGNGAEGPKGPRTKGTATRGPEGPESGQNMRVRGPEGSEDEQS